MDTVRVLRIVEYVGSRKWVEDTVAHAIHGTRQLDDACSIRAVTIGTYPEIPEQPPEPKEPQMPDSSVPGKPTSDQTTLAASNIPAYMHKGILNWVKRGVRPGPFLSAIISNDLYGAFTRADDQNVYLIREYFTWFYNYAPSICWGHPDALTTWRGTESPPESEGPTE